ncbi:hypothetical protein B4U79_17216 [Dinothrombium tinctorium]|uniref:Protection of telomeres protein 1 n=1 Tax=Dinothrombium tinctorium TaxID=1965070 RepID=A0A3S3NZP4_9ACAR|nr:hypothetical protein B4U79_16956 [Dinothrombium tinctorium]RWS00105.1 hypothetical protein B4U79_16922 [Dinothrombium tinctorium]RWS12289.1 hypothetical protein B4U79_17470 [Dinothrombium tinctorium]RWS15622.1 hypothetical protein B4U79_17216 [Dinothrombium tinctorium]
MCDFASNYVQLLNEVGPKYLPIKFVKQWNHSRKLKDTVNIYGVVKEIADFNENGSDSRKKQTPIVKLVTLIDPTDSEGLVLRVIDQPLYFVPSCALRVKGLKINTRNNIVEFIYDKVFRFPDEFSTDLHQMPMFEFDFAPGNECQHFTDETDEQIIKYLESWYSDKMLNETNLGSLPEPRSSHPSYINIACKVLSKRVLQQSVILRIWDGSKPNFKFDYKASIEYINNLAANHNAANAMCALQSPKTSLFKDVNKEVLNETADDLMLENSIVVNIWANESELNCNHFNAANSLTLKNGDDLLLLTNVEVNKAGDGDIALLVLRSGRHRGKGARVIRKEK